MNENLFQSVEKFGTDRVYVFQQDNDLKYTRIVKKCFKESGISIIFWSPQSSNLNPIEYLWDELDRQIQNNQKFIKSNFIATLKSKWNEITTDTWKKLMHSIPHHFLEPSLIKAKNYQTP